MATAGSGDENALIFWDSKNGNPIRTYFNPHPNGIVAMDISDDAMLLATLSSVPDGSDEIQTVAIWDWTNEDLEIPVASVKLNASKGGLQHCVKFNSCNKTEIMTIGDTSVAFLQCTPKTTTAGKGFDLQIYYPSMETQDSNCPLDHFCTGTFVGDTSAAAVTTKHGEMVIFDFSVSKGEDDKSSTGSVKEPKIEELERKLIKSMRISKSAIDFIDCTKYYIVTGCADGTVKFYDFEYRLVNWYEDFKFGGITSVSFVNDPDDEKDTSKGMEFKVPDFVVCTKQCAVIKVESESCVDFTMEKRHVRLLLRGQDKAICGLDAHPTRPFFVVSGLSGFVQVWNYETHTTLVTRQFDKGHNIYCVKYDPSGDTIALGFTNGEIKVVDSLSLRDYSTQSTYKISSSPILHIAFSSNGAHFAAATASFSVCLFKESDRFSAVPWQFIGTYTAHYKTISALEFLDDPETGKLRLFSLALDRYLVEYDLETSTLLDGVKLIAATELEQLAHPTALAWYPQITKEHFIMTANNEYKLKLYNTATKMCRKTSLGPTYAGPVTKLSVLPNVGSNGLQHYVAYGTNHRVVGLLNLPLDGNPFNNMALVAHAGEISNMTATSDGKYLLTAGGSDGAVYFWSLNTNALDALSSLGGVGLEPYLGLIEGGVDGEFFKELEDYFYYSQVMNDNEHKTRPRKVSDKVKIENIPTIFRALGFYPTEQGIEDIINELKFRDYVETGKYVTEVGIEELVQCK